MRNELISIQFYRENIMSDEGTECKESDPIEATASPPATCSPVKRSAAAIRSPKASPAKKLRLEIAKPVQSKPASSKSKYIYGNYNRYYGYRNSNVAEDVRIVAFRTCPEYFEGKEMLDIGCNDGAVTMTVAKELRPKFITGLDIDKDLVGAARKHLATVKRNSVMNNNSDKTNDTQFPNNIAFKQCNYVLDDERLLDLEQPQFDTILCLSVAKWIQLNFGDAGLKLAFKRMYRQLRPGGHLILETQNWKSYKRRKNLTPQIHEHFKNIKLLPTAFEQYLLSADIGFEQCTLMDLPEHVVKGFQRPIQIFRKPIKIAEVQLG